MYILLCLYSFTIFIALQHISYQSLVARRMLTVGRSDEPIFSKSYVTFSWISLTALRMPSTPFFPCEIIKKGRTDADRDSNALSSVCMQRQTTEAGVTSPGRAPQFRNWVLGIPDGGNKYQIEVILGLLRSKFGRFFRSIAPGKAITRGQSLGIFRALCANLRTVSVIGRGSVRSSSPTRGWLPMTRG